ncbi:MAG: DUF3604 domain-containing protein [Myxococcota bacterium]|nr:DUF3604 domain-containing protein [Myxococcota bacterium]
MKLHDSTLGALGRLAAALAIAGAAPAGAAERQLLWGDTHLHTNYSFDAYLFQNRTADPDTAYRYAKGLPVVHPFHGARVQIGTPLDFLVVADHAELTAVPLRIFEGDPALLATAFGRDMAPLIAAGKGGEVFRRLVATANAGTGDPRIEELRSAAVRVPAWHHLVDAADRHDDPGTFTALIGWEWSSLPDAANLHRVVMLADDGAVAKQFLPFSTLDSDRPEDLWAWLERTTAATGAEFVAIPHNMNISKGRMFPLEDSEGRPLTAEYARTRMRWEPVAEITQIKGDSETHPALSPNDEFADFETYRFLIDTRPDTDHLASVTRGDYARGALLRGLELEETFGANPYKFGMIGATDAHTGVASAEEDNFHGKMALDSVPEKKPERRISGGDGPIGWNMAAQGLAGVWAEANTRAAIVAAFKRKEVYATTGPRIQLRFFGGWEFAAADASAADLAARGYAGGVPMGGDLSAAPAGRAPSFLIHAAKDPVGANLDRIQVVKGWLGADGKASERVFNVAASDGRTPDVFGVLSPVGSTVDLATATWTNDIGNPQLAAVWTDPEFDAGQRAFYYVRVLQIPTPRHSLYDAVALGRELPEGISATLQERAYSSPIWYTP